MNYLEFRCGFTVLPEAVVNSAVAFSMPPYVCNTNWASALACQHHADQLSLYDKGPDRESFEDLNLTLTLTLKVLAVNHSKTSSPATMNLSEKIDAQVT